MFTLIFSRVNQKRVLEIIFDPFFFFPDFLAKFDVFCKNM